MASERERTKVRARRGRRPAHHYSIISHTAPFFIHAFTPCNFSCDIYNVS